MKKFFQNCCRQSLRTWWRNSLRESCMTFKGKLLKILFMNTGISGCNPRRNPFSNPKRFPQSLEESQWELLEESWTKNPIKNFRRTYLRRPRLLKESQKTVLEESLTRNSVRNFPKSYKWNSPRNMSWDCFGCSFASGGNPQGRISQEDRSEIVPGVRSGFLQKF